MSLLFRNYMSSSTSNEFKSVTCLICHRLMAVLKHEEKVLCSACSDMIDSK